MDRRSFELIAKMLSGKLNVSFHPSKDWRWEADIAKKIIYYPKDTEYSDGDIGSLIHEAAHIKFSDYGMTPEQLEAMSKKFYSLGKIPSQIYGLINALEDGRVNRLIRKDYPGVKRYQIADANQGWKIQTEHTQDANFIKNKDKLLWYVYAIYRCAEENQIGKKGAEEYLEMAGMENEKKLLEAIANTDQYIETCYTKKSITDLIDFCFEFIMPHYLPLCEDFDENNAKEMMENIKEFLEELKKLVEEIGKEIQEKASKGEGMKIEIDATGGMKEKLDEKIEENSKKTGGNGVGKEINYNDPQLQFLDETALSHLIKERLPSVRKAVSILKDKETKRFEGSYSSGKLQNKKLYKMASNSYKVFSRKTELEKGELGVVIAVVVDVSGSMNEYGDGGSKIKKVDATIATGLLARAMDLSGKQFIINGYDNFNYSYKKYGERFSLKQLVLMQRSGGGGTNDAMAIRKATKELEHLREKHKVMIVLSDGDGCGGEQEALEEANQKKIDVYGVGIQHDVSHKYKNAIKVDDPAELGKELYKIFAKYAGKRVR